MHTYAVHTLVSPGLMSHNFAQAVKWPHCLLSLPRDQHLSRFNCLVNGTQNHNDLCHDVYKMALYMYLYLSRDARKPVIGVSDQARHKPACSSTEKS